MNRIGDSTAIIAALEEAYPEPPLYPSGPGDRARALELEEFFDEELAPHLRLLAWYYLRQDPKRFRDFAVQAAPGPLRSRRLSGWTADTFLKARYHVADEDRGRSRETRSPAQWTAWRTSWGTVSVFASATRVHGRLTSLLRPSSIPSCCRPRGHGRSPIRRRIRRCSVRCSSERRGYRWIGETFARHRKRSG